MLSILPVYSAKLECVTLPALSLPICVNPCGDSPLACKYFGWNCQTLTGSNRLCIRQLLFSRRLNGRCSRRPRTGRRARGWRRSCLGCGRLCSFRPVDELRRSPAARERLGRNGPSQTPGQVLHVPEHRRRGPVCRDRRRRPGCAQTRRRRYKPPGERYPQIAPGDLHVQGIHGARLLAHIQPGRCRGCGLNLSPVITLPLYLSGVLNRVLALLAEPISRPGTSVCTGCELEGPAGTSVPVEDLGDAGI